jgi:Fe2+ transport system protein FeoA
MTPVHATTSLLDTAGAEEDDALPLSHAPLGWRRTVLAVDGPDRHELALEGVLPGSVLVVTARTPFGGPLVVELGRARVALSARVAGQVVTRGYAPADDARAPLVPVMAPAEVAPGSVATGDAP